MMRIMKPILLIATLAIIITACEKNIEVKVPQQPSKLVINSITKVNTPFTVFVTKTAGILEPGNLSNQKLTNASVYLYKDKVLVDSFAYNPVTENYSVRNNTLAKAGHTYQLKAIAPGFTGVEATSTIPSFTPIESISMRKNARQTSFGDRLDEVKITFRDDVSNSNYYQLKVLRPYFNQNNSIDYSPIYCIYSNDKDIDRGNNTDFNELETCLDNNLLIADKNFNGQLKTFILYILQQDLEPVFNSATNTTAYPVLELQSITSDYFRYRKSYDAYLDAKDNPFAEPVLIYSNVTNGYGIFTLYNKTEQFIR
jgi:hypothetical protein